MTQPPCRTDVLLKEKTCLFGLNGTIVLARFTARLAQTPKCAVHGRANPGCCQSGRNEVLPILGRQTAFSEVLPFYPEQMNERKLITTRLGATKAVAERYEKDFYSQVHQTVKPYLATAITVSPYPVETTLCQHFVDALGAGELGQGTFRSSERFTSGALAVWWGTTPYNMPPSTQLEARPLRHRAVAEDAKLASARSGSIQRGIQF